MQGATQGTAPAAQVGSLAAEHPEAGEETAQDEDQDKRGEENLGLGGSGVTTDRDKAAAMSIMPGCQHHNLATWPKGPGCLPCPKKPNLVKEIQRRDSRSHPTRWANQKCTTEDEAEDDEEPEEDDDEAAVDARMGADEAEALKDAAFIDDRAEEDLSMDDDDDEF